MGFLSQFSRYRRLIRQGVVDPRWFLFYLQRLELDAHKRVLVSRLIARALPHSDPFGIPHRAHDIAKTMREDGFRAFPDFVRPDQIADIHRYLADKSCFDPHRETKPHFVGPDAAHPECLVAYYPIETVQNMPHAVELANHPDVLGGLEATLGCKPTLSFMSLWWTRHGFDPGANECVIQNPNVFHRDFDDWAQIKLFVYLTDVDEASGPHGYIRGSHKPAFLPGRKDVDIKTLPPVVQERVTRFTAPAGTAFLENSLVMHRGIEATAKNRLMLHFTYSLFPLPYSPKDLRPMLTSAKIDPYINRCYFRPVRPVEGEERSRRPAEARFGR